MKADIIHWKLNPRRLAPCWLAMGMALIALPGLVRAQKVSADLSQEFSAVGQPVQLNVSVVGGRGAQVPQRITVDGLDIRFAGRSEQVNVVNFQMTVSSIFSYLVVPMKAGDFVIPSIPVNVGGKTFKTSPLSLRVGGNSGGVPVLPAIPVHPPGSQSIYPPSQAAPSRQQAAPTPIPADKIAFGELIVPKKSAYVGEVVPVEMRFYFIDGMPVRVSDRPSFSGDGFTVMNFSKPVERQQQVGDDLYNVVVFQTAITAVKAGPLEISPATIQSQVSVPGNAPQGMDDFLSSFFANSGFGMETRDLEVATKPAQLEVKPLPTEGRPMDFSGAIGQFSLRATASPKKAGAGDPISLDVTVAGRGNFSGFGAPALMDAEAWRSYPPGEDFVPSASDPIGFNGEKIFKYMIVARTDTDVTPAPEFSFFDPAVEKYVTLRASPIAVVAKGASASSATVASSTPAPQSSPTPAAPAASAPVPPWQGASDLMAHSRPGTFEPMALQRVFVLANLVAALGWLAIGGFALIRAIAHSDLARRSGHQRTLRRQLHHLQDPSLSPEEFLQAAVDFVRARIVPEGSSRDTRELIEGAAIRPDTRDALLALLNHGDEWKYAASTSAFHLGADKRQEILNHLKSFDEELH